MVDPRAAAGACRRMAFVYEFEAADEFDMIDTDVPTTLRRPKADFEGSKAVSSSGHALLHAHACMHACMCAREEGVHNVVCCIHVGELHKVTSSSGVLAKCHTPCLSSSSVTPVCLMRLGILPMSLYQQDV